MLESSGALQKGHFRLTTGRHSEVYLQCSLLLQIPNMAKQIVEDLICLYHKQISTDTPDVILSPALGGIVLGTLIGHHLNTKNIFAERFHGEGKLLLRRGFKLRPRDNVLLVEDVITTGGSCSELKTLCYEYGSSVLGTLSIVNRKSSTSSSSGIISLFNFDIEDYDPQLCPLCRKNIPLTQLGSRKIQ